MDIREEKKAVRDRLRAARCAFSASASNAAADLCRLFIEQINLPIPSVVSGYSSIDGEIDILPLMAVLRDQGHTLCLPVIVAPQTPLKFRTYETGDNLHKGMLSILEPSLEKEEVTPTVMLLPLLAFDSKCHRLGYGGGYFDRTLNLLKRKTPNMRAYGIAFSMQEIARVPTGRFDVPLDAIITERKVFWRHTDAPEP